MAKKGRFITKEEKEVRARLKELGLVWPVDSKTYYKALRKSWAKDIHGK